MQNQIFYHIYPLGLVGATKENDFKSTPTENLKKVAPWLEHMVSLGCTALYLGPVFEATSHGYDTANYLEVDRRLGTNTQLKQLVTKAHDMGVKVLFDAVFNHVGRDFWAFKDLQENGKASKYKDWFSNVDFSQEGVHGDGFSYDGWHGYYQLPELNLKNIEVQAYLFSVVTTWINAYHIDGLRLDAADVIDLDFLRELSAFCKTKKSNFWLLGEVVFGDYREWAKEGMLDCVTNYEYHTPLYDSFNQQDFNHIASILQRQFGAKGSYKNIVMYSFVDNHDVDRAASALAEPGHLFPLYLLLFTLPGIPAIYNGSEWGFEGKIANGKHDALRPEITLQNFDEQAKHPLLLDAIKQFTAMRKAKVCLQKGEYQELLVNKEQLVFVRVTNGDFVICIINASRHAATLKIPMQGYTANHYTDILNKEYTCQVKEGFLYLEVPSWWGRVLAPLAY